MYKQDLYHNYKQEKSNVIKNDLSLKERQFISSNLYDENMNNYIDNRCENISHDLIPEKQGKDNINCDFFTRF